MIKIKNINEPEIKYYRTLRFTPEEHIKEKIFVAEGEKVVKRLLESGLEIHAFFALEKYYDKYSLLIKKAGVTTGKSGNFTIN